MRHGQKLHVAVSDLLPDPAEAAWVEEHVRALAGVEADGRGRRSP